MKQLFLLLFIFTVTCGNSQSLQWVNGMGSTAGDFANGVTTDASGNVYHVGGFNGSVDFDPSAATSSLTAGGAATNGYISKLTSADVFVWSVGLLGTDVCNPKDVKTDASGNVYVTGYFSGTVDFNPGAGTFTMSSSSATDYDVFVCKLNSAGVFQWAKKIGGAFTDFGNAIALDGTGNVFVAGYASSSTSASTVIDFDPGVAVANFTIGYTDGFLLKLDNNGNYITAQSYGTFNNNEQVTSLYIDASNTVYLGGFYEGNVSNLGLTPISLFQTHPFVAKLTNTLTLLWSARFTPSGTNPSARVTALKVDASGNVYSTGYFSATYDFDPSGASNTLSSSGLGDIDVFVTKLSSAGAFVWTNRIASGANDAYSTGLAMDAANNVMVAGYFAGTADFDPTASSYLGYSAGSNDAFVCRLDQNGVFNNSLQTHGSSGDDRVNVIHATSAGPYYLGGFYANTVDFNITATTNTVVSNGAADLFLAKYNQCSTPNKPTASTPTAVTICPNTQTVISVTAVAGVTINWYTSSTGGALLGSGNSFTTPITASTASYWAQATNTCSTNQIRTQYSVTVSGTTPTVNISASSSTICAGSTTSLTASGASTYSWNTGATTTVVAVSPSSATVYTVTGTIGSCSTTKTITINVTQNPTVNIAATSSSLCSGANAVLTASGAANYSWSTGATTSSISVSPSSNTIYTVTGTTSGCANTKTLSVTVQITPTVAVSNTTICRGSSVTLSASGATTYSWNTGAITNTISVSPTSATNYTVTGTTNGCINTKTVNVSVIPTPTVVVSNTTICSGTSVTLSALGASTYVWNTGATTNSIFVSPTSNTTYTVTGTATGCVDTKTVSVSVTPSPTVSVNSPTICNGATAVLAATGATTYSWNTGSTTSNIAVAPPSTMMFTVTGTTSGCTNAKTATVTVNPLPNLSVSSSTICSGSTGTLVAIGAATYTWNTGGTGASLAVNPTVNTNYTVTGTSTAGCVKTATASVTVGSAPSIAANSTSICIGSSATITASGVNTYTWNTSSNSSSITVNPTSTTVYTVSGNLVGCATTAVKTVTVTVNSLPIVTLGTITSPLCVNNAALPLLGSPSGGIYSGAGVSGSNFDPALSGAGTFTVTYNYTDVNSCSAAATKTVNVSLCTDLATLSGALDATVSVYPNPNNGEFTISVRTKGNYSIINAIGQTVETININEDAQSSYISGLSQGIYYLIGKNVKAKIVVVR